MKIFHISILAVTAAAFAACAPYPPLSGQASSGDAQAQAPASDEVPAPAVENSSSNVPLGRPSPDGKTNTVISPYRPYNLIDVTGYKSGDIVGDPSTAQVDPATGKVNLSTAKHFRLP